MDLKLTYRDYTLMLRELDSDIGFILAKINAANKCIATSGSYLNQIEACTVAGSYYKKRLIELLHAKLAIAVERAMLEQ